VYYKTYAGSLVSKSVLISMSSTEEIWRYRQRVSWVIGRYGIKQKNFEKSYPITKAFLEWYDIISERTHNQRDQEMVRLLKEYVKKMNSDKN